jgi:hypothetical protein
MLLIGEQKVELASCVQIFNTVLVGGIQMSKFVGNIVISVVIVGAALAFLKTLPDLARYMKLREM